MRISPLAIALLVAAPAFGQARVYTNADLGKPMPRTSTVTSAEAAAILAPWQFVYVPPRPAQPQVIRIDSSPTAGPFGEFAPLEPHQGRDGWSYASPSWLSTFHSGRYSGRSRGAWRDNRHLNDVSPGFGPGFGFPDSGGGNPSGGNHSGKPGREAGVKPAPRPSPVAPAPPPVERVVPPPAPLGFPAYRRSSQD